MSYVVSYRKNITRHTTEDLGLPEGGVELCAIEGVTYASIPDGHDIESTPQPDSVLATLSRPDITPELRAAICAASTQVWLINERVRDKIAEQYSLHDELKLLRTAPSPEFEAYSEHVEHCRTWGRVQKEALGLRITGSTGKEVK